MAALGGSLGWTNSESGGFNNRGEMIGISNLAGDQIAHPFLWDGEKLIDLNTGGVGGNPLDASALNDIGDVVGQALFSNQFFHAYRWRNGVVTDLGTVGADDCSAALGINNRGQIVGQSFACDGSGGHPFLWEDGSMVDLSSLIFSGSSLQLVETRAINDRGEIAGIGIPPGCTVVDTQCGHAFVLIPCDANHLNVEGCDYGMVDVAEIANNAAAPQFTQAIPPTMEPPSRTINPWQNWFSHRYQMFGQPPALRH